MSLKHLCFVSWLRSFESFRPSLFREDANLDNNQQHEWYYIKALSSFHLFARSFVDNLEKLKLTPSTCKTVNRRKIKMIFHPTSGKALVVYCDGVGNLGFWDVLQPKLRILTQPHSEVITEVNVHRHTPNRVVTASHDGSLRVTDMESMRVVEPYRSEDEMRLFSFDFATPNVVIMGQSNSRARVLDLRATGWAVVVISCWLSKALITNLRLPSSHCFYTHDLSFPFADINRVPLSNAPLRNREPCIQCLSILFIQIYSLRPMTGESCFAEKEEK